MKLNLLVIILLLSAFYNGLNAQWAIKHLNENAPYDYNLIKFKNDSLGLCMGDRSMILKSEDMGETWSAIPLNIAMNIKDFQFIGNSSIFAVGHHASTSKFIKSDDLGETWDSISAFQGQELRSIHFFNNDSGIIAGYNRIYRTVNSGNSWQIVWGIKEFGYQFGEITQVSFHANVGYAIGLGRTQNNNPNFHYFLLKSNDAGSTWDTLKTFEDPLNTIHFISQDTGFVGMYSSAILKTTDGGLTWEETKVKSYIKPVNSIHFTSHQTGFASGGEFSPITTSSTFFISKTADGGATWESFDTLGIPLNSIHYLNDSVGFVSGSFGLIMKSSGNTNRLPVNYPWHLVGDVTSLNESQADQFQTKIYPNPASGTLYIQPSGSAQDMKSLRLINTEGHVLDIVTPSSYHDSIIPINLSEVAPGLYVIQITYSNKVESLKFIHK